MPHFRSLLPRLLNYRPGEGRLLWLFLLLCFLRGICDVFFATAASTLYLQYFGAGSLPWVYVASAAVVTLLGFGYARLTARTSVPRLLKQTLVFVTLSIGALHLLLGVSGSKWWAMGLMVWRDAIYTLLNATFWAQVGLLFNVRQGKRLFPVIAGGDIISAAAGGAIIPLVVRRIGVLHLLYFAEASIALCLLVSVALDRATRGVANPAGEEETEPDRRPLSRLVRERYLTLFFGVSILSFLIYHFVDYNFYTVVNQRISNPTDLASFFGVYSAVVNGLGLALNGIIAGRILSRYGILAGWLVVPVFVGAGTLAALGLPAFGIPSVFFWAIVATKLMDEMLRGAFLHPTYRILYQPLPPRERVRVQAVRDSIVEPLAIGLSGLLLLALTRAADFTIWQLCVVLLGILAVFLVLSVALRKEYVAVLGKALARRRPLDGSSLLGEASSVAVLRRGARSDKPAEVLYCLGLLEQASPALARTDLLAALDRPESEVRAYALRRLRATGAVELVWRVVALLGTEPSVEVLGEALWTLSDLSAGTEHERVAPFLTHSDPQVRRGAMVGLLRHLEHPSATMALEHLDQLLRSPAASERIMAADVLGAVESAAFADCVLTLLADQETGVVRAALAAAARIRTPSLLSGVLVRLYDPALKESAAAALVLFGDAVVPAMAKELAAAVGRADAARIVRILGRIRTPTATGALTQQISHADENVRRAVLAALARVQFVAGPGESGQVGVALREELANAAWLLACLRDLEGSGEAELVRRALGNDLEEAGDRVLLLLSFLYPRHTILNARTILRYGSDDQRAQALEAIDNLLPRDLNEAVGPFFDDLTLLERLGRINRVFAQRTRRPWERLRELIGAPAWGLSHWSRACALYAGAQGGDPGLRDSVQEATRDADPLVRETAAWWIGRAGWPR